MVLRVGLALGFPLATYLFAVRSLSMLPQLSVANWVDPNIFSFFFGWESYSLHM